jgi:hypothetical protein
MPGFVAENSLVERKKAKKLGCNAWDVAKIFWRPVIRFSLRASLPVREAKILSRAGHSGGKQNTAGAAGTEAGLL